MTPSMSRGHLLLLIGVQLLWGVNFVVIDIGLAHVPPLLFSALRFAVAAVPAILVLRHPGVPWRWATAVALVLGVAQFGLLFSGMAAGMPPGLSSLVLQAQVGFTALFAVLALRERPGARRLAGLVIAAGGITLIAFDLGATSPLSAFGLIVAAASMWGLGNVLMRKAAPPDSLRFMVWVSAIAVLPLLALSAIFEGPQRDLAALRTVPVAAIGAVLYVGLVATVVGFGVWGYLIRTYSASTVAPFSMLAPVFAMLTSALTLHEQITPLRVVAAVLIVGGVLVGALGGTRTPRRDSRPTPELTSA